MRRHLILSIALSVLLVATTLAQQPPQQPAPTFKSGTQVVELDVRVFDKDGRFVTGLTPADFEVIEDGAAQKVQTFFYVDDPGRATGASSTPPPSTPSSTDPAGSRRPRQTWIFFFDLNHLTPGGGY